MNVSIERDVRRRAAAAVSYGREAVTRPAGAAVDYGPRAATALDTVLADAVLAATGRAAGLAAPGQLWIEFQARQTVVVGQRMTLDVTNLPSVAAGTAALKSIRWTIPGEVVKFYHSTFSETAPIRLNDADKAQSRIEFYWVDGGDGRKVTADCVFVWLPLNTDIHVTLYAMFDVKAPTLIELKDIRPKGKWGKTRTWHSRGKEALEFTGEIASGFKRDDGVVWEFKIRIPQGFDGRVKDVQTVYEFAESTGRVAGSRDQKRWVYKLPGRALVSMPGHGPPSGSLVVDDYESSHPWEQSPVYSIDVKNVAGTRTSPKFPAEVKGGEVFQAGDIFDAPDQAFEESWVGFRIHAAFKYFIMYKPSTFAAIWVPVAKIEWFWKGEARKVGGQWHLVQSESAGGVTSPGRKGEPTTEFPEYQGSEKEQRWEEVPA